MEFDETLLIVNPASGSSDVAIGELLSRLETAGPVRVRRTDDDGSTNEWLLAHAGPNTRVVIGGGDGTLNHLIRAVLESGATLAILPLGTANDFARALDIPAEPDEALTVALEGAVRRVDVGCVNGDYFLNAVGIGLGPAMTKELSDEKKQKFGVFAYPLTLLGVISDGRSFKATVIIDGVRRRMKALQITVASGIHYGGGMTVSDDAQLDDGLLQLLSVRPQSIWRLMSHFFAMRWGAIRGKTDLKLYTGESIEILTDNAMDVTADGELVATTPLKLQCKARRLPVLVPSKE